MSGLTIQTDVVSTNVLVLQAQSPKQESTWDTFWVAEEERERVRSFVADAFYHQAPAGIVDLVTRFLKKWDVHTLDPLKKAAGGKEKLDKLLEHDVGELQLPPGIDRFLQTPLTQFWDQAVVEHIKSYAYNTRFDGDIEKINDLFILVYRPAGMSAPRALSCFSGSFKVNADMSDQRIVQALEQETASQPAWLLVSRFVFGRGQTLDQNAFEGNGFTRITPADALLSEFLHRSETEQRIYWTKANRSYTVCAGPQFQGRDIHIGDHTNLAGITVYAPQPDPQSGEYPEKYYTGVTLVRDLTENPLRVDEVGSPGAQESGSGAALASPVAVQKSATV